MSVATIVCLVAIAVLIVVVVRLRRRNVELAELARRTAHERDHAVADAVNAAERATAARTERDEALDRVQRARRDAAEVANRLKEETVARTAAEGAVEAAGAERERLQAELDARMQELQVATDAVAMSGGDSSAAATVLWALALDRIERTWRTSIALHADERSPLEGSDDPLRVAVEILAEAAREEAGADIDVLWDGAGADVPTVRAVQTLALLESLIAAVAKDAAGSALSVAVTPTQVEIDVTTDDGQGREVPLDVPDELVEGPGRYVVAG